MKNRKTYVSKLHGTLSGSVKRIPIQYGHPMMMTGHDKVRHVRILISDVLYGDPKHEES